MRSVKCISLAWIVALSVTGILPNFQSMCVAQNGDVGVMASVDCGPNAAYVFIKAWGKECSREALLSRGFEEGGENGVSLKALRNWCSVHGLETKVISSTTEEILQLAPCIAHLGDTTSGHFVVLLGESGGRIELIDGTSGDAISVGRGEWDREFSGYALVLARTTQARLPPLYRVLLILAFVSIGVSTLVTFLGTYRDRKVNFFAIIVIVLCFPGSNAYLFGQEFTVESIKEQIRESQRRVWRVEGGFILDYNVQIEQQPDKPFLIWNDQIRGELVIRWPELRTLNEGDMRFMVNTNNELREATERTMREAYFNFSTGKSIAREGDVLGQITPYRHTFTGDTMYPLTFQYFEDAYVLKGDSSPNKRLLPSGIDDSATVNLEGPLVRVSQPMSVIWLDQNLGFVLVKREIRASDGRLFERVENSDFRELSPGAWFPMIQQKEVFDLRANDSSDALHLVKMRIESTIIRIGSVADSDLVVSLPDSLPMVEDQIANRIYRSRESEDAAFSRAIAVATDSAQRNSRVSRIFLLSIFGVILLSVFIIQRWFRSRK
jgi:hypothetical protein